MPRLTRLSRSVAGKVALVTGAASGMGRATAHLFADEGALVAVTDLDAAAVQKVVDEIEGAGGKAAGWAMDVTDTEAVDRVVGEAAERFGGLDIVVNNAGIALFAPLDSDQFEKAWSVSLDVMLTGQTRVIRAALPHLRRSDGGRIINIASTEALGATRYALAYTAAKTGVVGLTRSLALEFAREGITVNCVCPGPVQTGMTAAIPEEQKQEFARRRTALGRYADPEEVAHGTLNFALPASSFMTGAVLVVDGGVTVRNA